MDKYEVIIRDKQTGNRWSMIFDADDFGHAEDQACDISADGQVSYLAEDDEIIRTDKEYEVIYR